jgi:hypothetical protein
LEGASKGTGKSAEKGLEGAWMGAGKRLEKGLELESDGEGTAKLESIALEKGITRVLEKGIQRAHIFWRGIKYKNQLFMTD